MGQVSPRGMSRALRSRNGSVVSFLLSAILLMSVAGGLLCSLALLGSVPLDDPDPSEVQPVAWADGGAPILPQALRPERQVALARWGTRCLARHDLKTGQVLQVLPKYGQDVIDVRASGDGTLYALAYRDGSFVVAGETEKDLCRGRVSKTVAALALSADGAQVAISGMDGSIHLWDTQAGTLVRTLNVPADSVTHLEFSPDRRLLASSGFHAVYLWELAGGTLQHTWEAKPHITALKFSPDGGMLAIGDFETVVLRWTDTGAEVWSRPSDGAVRALAFSPDGKRLASACDRRIRFWAAGSGALTMESVAHGDMVRCIRFSADGRELLSATRAGIVRRWDAESGKELSRVMLSAR